MSVLDVPLPPFMAEDEIRIFAGSVGRFLEQAVPPARSAKWREQGHIDPGFWREAGAAGLLGVSIPEQYGGGGGDFRHDLVILEQVLRKEVSGFSASLQNGIATPYILAHGAEAQKQRWLPRLCRGELVAALAMSEPGAGSDLQSIRTFARREDDGYRINGSKTFISSGLLANFIILVVKTDPELGAKGVSLVVVETEQAEGFRRGRLLKKMGHEAADTAELFFDDVWVPADNLLGLEEGQGFRQLMKELPRERLVIALQSIWAAEIALELTLAYVKERKAFGQPIFGFQNTQFKLADLAAEMTAAKVFMNWCVERHFAGTFDTTMASKAKLLATELQGRVVDACLQFHGGYGYTDDFRISRLYRDARISRIYGGSNEVMRMLIARKL
jgi:acyl-CoA dehydrogenase